MSECVWIHGKGVSSHTRAQRSVLGHGHVAFLRKYVILTRLKKIAFLEGDEVMFVFFKVLFFSFQGAVYI